MHYVAGALLIVQTVLILVLDRSIDSIGLNILAWTMWTISIILIILPMSILRRRGGVADRRSYTETQVVVDRGLYAFVRHPQYLGWMLMYLVAYLFNPRLLLGVIGLIGAACVYVFTRQEDQLLVEKFGEPYIRYMKSVPRFNILLGITRRLQRNG